MVLRYAVVQETPDEVIAKSELLLLNAVFDVLDCLILLLVVNAFELLFVQMLEDTHQGLILVVLVVLSVNVFLFLLVDDCDLLGFELANLLPKNFVYLLLFFLTFLQVN